MKTIQVDVQAVAAGQAVSLLTAARRHRSGREVPGLALASSLDLVVGAVAVRGLLVLHGNHKLVARRQFQRIRRVPAVLDGLGIGMASAAAVPLAADELVTLARKQDSKLVAEVIFEIN